MVAQSEEDQSAYNNNFRWLIAVDSVNAVMYICLFSFVCYVIYRLLIKYAYYKDWNLSMFYICAFMICIGRITEYCWNIVSHIIEFNDDDDGINQ